MATSTAIFSIITNPDQASLKRLAWAFGCAKKGSTEEAQLERLLIDRVASLAPKTKTPTSEEVGVADDDDRSAFLRRMQRVD